MEVIRKGSLVMPLSENFQTKTKPIPTECHFGKPNTKPILYGLQKTDICTKFFKKLIFMHIKVFYKQKKVEFMRSKKASYIMYYIDIEHKYTTKNGYVVEVHSASPGSIILK